MTTYWEKIEIIWTFRAESWKISFPKTKHHCHAPDFYINDGVTITNDKKVITEQFDSFFVNLIYQQYGSINNQ